MSLFVIIAGWFGLFTLAFTAKSVVTKICVFVGGCALAAMFDTKLSEMTLQEGMLSSVFAGLTVLWTYISKKWVDEWWEARKARKGDKTPTPPGPAAGS